MINPLRLLGHRGACAERPENTMPSFERAVAIGVDVLETDVHMTADGHVVVSHDDGGKRAAGVDRLIRACSLEEVRRWDAGYTFVQDGDHPYRGKGLRIPTLVELLETFPATALNIDIKQREPNMVAPLLELLDAHDGAERVTLASFHDEVLRELRARGWRGSMVCGRREVLLILLAPLAIARQLGVHGDTVQVPLRAGPFDLSSTRFLGRCHRLGLRVDYWTVNDPAVANALLSRGADGIISDDPAALEAVFDRYRERPC